MEKEQGVSFFFQCLVFSKKKNGRRKLLWNFLFISITSKNKMRKAGRGSPNWPASMIPPPLLDLGEYNKDKLRKEIYNSLLKGGSVCAFASLCRSIVNKQTLIMFSQQISKSLSLKQKYLLLVNEQCS